MKTSCSQRLSDVLPKAGNMLILGFNLAISPKRVCCSRSQSDAQFLCPVKEVGINKSSTSVVYNRLRKYERMYTFLSGRDSSRALMFVTGYTIRKRKKASMTKGNVDFGYLVGAEVLCYRNGLFGTGRSLFATLPMVLHFCVWVPVCYLGMWGSQQ